MKLYENCFYYKLAADVITAYVDKNWEIELDIFKKSYNSDDDFMDNLFGTIYFIWFVFQMEKCYEIQLVLNSHVYKHNPVHFIYL